MDDLRQIREDLKDHQEYDARFHTEMLTKLDDISKKLDPVLDTYKAFLFSKNFVTGLASVFVGITAIGAGIVWLINQAIEK